MATDTRLALTLGLDPLGSSVDVLALIVVRSSRKRSSITADTLGTFRPDAAIISRITSFTPPPNVITRFRLVWLSSHFSSSAVSGSAGLPYLPTISSASRPTY